VNSKYLIGIVISSIVLVVGLVLTAITPFQSVNTNPYLTVIDKNGVVYGVILGVGFIALYTLLQYAYEER